MFVTTDAVLIEVLNYFSDYGPTTRGKTSQIVHEILSYNDFTVVEETRSVFLKARDPYKSRLDKGYSLTDCISMNVCRELLQTANRDAFPGNFCRYGMDQGFGVRDRRHTSGVNWTAALRMVCSS